MAGHIGAAAWRALIKCGFFASRRLNMSERKRVLYSLVPEPPNTCGVDGAGSGAAGLSSEQMVI